MTVLTKKYLTVHQLAAHWEWPMDDVYYLLDEGLLLTTPKLAASKGKQHVRVVVVRMLDERTILDLEGKYPHDYIEIVSPEPGEEDSEAKARTWRLLAEDGELQRVITVAEIERVEKEHPDWFAKPKHKRPAGPREKTLYAVIAAMAKTLGYTQCR